MSEKRGVAEAYFNGESMRAQYVASRHRRLLERQGFFGSMSLRCNPYGSAQAESLMNTLKVEAAYVTEYKTFNVVATDLPNFFNIGYNATSLHSALSYRSPSQFEAMNAAPGQKNPPYWSSPRSALQDHSN